MIEPASEDVVAVPFAGASAGLEPLTWGQQAIYRDMQDSGNQFSMGGMASLPDGGSVADVVARLSGVIGRHASLRMRLRADGTGLPRQEIAASGKLDLAVLTIADDAGRDDIEGYVRHRMDTWPLTRFDFGVDLPLRVAVLRQRGACVYLVWALSHLAADGGGHVLLLNDVIAAGPPAQPPSQDVLSIARSEQTPQIRRLSSRAMQYWESRLRDIPAQTFGPPVPPADPAARERYWQARFSSPAAHLAMRAIAGRTGTHASRVTVAVIATAIARAAGVHPLTLKVMVSNRFRPGFSEVIAPIAQNSAVTFDVADRTVDEVVAQAAGALMTAGLRAYYDPADLSQVMARLDAERGYPATVTVRINDQRAMVMGADSVADPGDVTPEQIKQALPRTSLTWLGPRHNMHEQANILVENLPDVVSLHIMWDSWSLDDSRIEALLRAVEDVAVDAASDPDLVALATRRPGLASLTSWLTLR